MLFRKNTAAADVAPQVPPAAAATAQALPSAATRQSQPEVEEAQRRFDGDRKLAAVLGEIVVLLMRSPQKAYAVQDLQWLVMPAIRHGQFAVADAEVGDPWTVHPMGAILWALVSPEVDKRLSAAGGELERLPPSEWRSGDIPWIVLALGEQRVTSTILHQLHKGAFKGREPKLWVRGADGKPRVGRLQQPGNTARA